MNYFYLHQKCRHCNNNLKYSNDTESVCLYCKYVIMYAVSRQIILSENYYDDSLGLFLSESEYGSMIFKPFFVNKKRLQFDYDDDSIIYVCFNGFNDLEFHRNRLKSIYKSLILK